MLRSILATAAFAAIAAPAFASNSYTFETVNPVSQKRIVAESVVWSCEGTTCRAELDRKAPTVRICKKIAKEVGEVSALRNTKSELTAEQLAECNTAAKK
ncbi:MAG: CC_3452 family protein [Hyphomonas sp.]